MSSVSKRKKEGYRGKFKTMGDHKEFLKRITKTLYYGQLPTLPCLSLPVTEIACEVWSSAQRGRSLRRLRTDAAAATARAACVSPCALVLALLYVERLQRCNPDYLAASDPDQLFLVSLMVSNKFLQDDGEDDEVICSEWATSGGLTLSQLKKLELEFLNAIDWNVYVSARSFSAGLARLERRVALRQGRARGWFTYGDLTAAAPAALPAAALASLAAAAALLASALLVAHSSSLAPTQPATPRQTTTLHADVAPPASNATTDDRTEPLAKRLADETRCCPAWLQYDRQETALPWLRHVPLPEPETSGGAAEWLYRSALLNPLLRWLEQMSRYSELLLPRVANHSTNRCAAPYDRCPHSWLNFSRLSLYTATVSER
ncbi:protein CNPPD1 [Aricia agestis]|uniref:protein CNPPD1 n=1 Tax=Aricia agestis TaxID=91739 RepID=UPI001C207835|nr:protein CNPPD1 [Aricia agestis]